MKTPAAVLRRANSADVFHTSSYAHPTQLSDTPNNLFRALCQFNNLLEGPGYNECISQEHQFGVHEDSLLYSLEASDVFIRQ